MGLTRLLLLGLFYTIQMQIYVLFCTRLKKHSVTKIFSDLSQFEQIVLVVPNFLQIQNNFSNKIPFLLYFLAWYVLLFCTEHLDDEISSPFQSTCLLETVQEFLWSELARLIESKSKWKTSYFSLNHTIVKLTKIMNNLAKDLYILIFKVLFLCRKLMESFQKKSYENLWLEDHLISMTFFENFEFQSTFWGVLLALFIVLVVGRTKKVYFWLVIKVVLLFQWPAWNSNV